MLLVSETSLKTAENGAAKMNKEIKYKNIYYRSKKLMKLY
jgi:hypothetical protein